MTSTLSSRPRSRQGGGTTLGAVLAILLVLFGALGVWWTSSGDDEATVDPDRTVAVQRRELLDAVNANGRVEPLARVAVMSRASGILEKILVEEGDAVTVGQVLAELDREQLQAQLDQDRADLASAEARVAAAVARLEEARVRVDDPELDYVRREAARMDELLASGDVSQRERDVAGRDLASVEFRVAQVRATLPVLAASVKEAEANLASAAAAVDRSETAMREATIRCPIDGIVLVRDKEVGDGVSSILTAGGNATQIMTLGDLSEMHIEARVDEVDLGRITVGMPARVTVDAHRGNELHGRVDRIAPAGSVDDNGIVTFEVRITVDDPDQLLKPDMTADARLVLNQRPDALTLPHRALTREADGWSVLVVSGDTAVRRKVEIGLSDGLTTEITAGLGEDNVVLLPLASTGGRGP
jgi:HlyD family secretion protein